HVSRFTRSALLLRCTLPFTLQPSSCPAATSTTRFVPVLLGGLLFAPVTTEVSRTLDISGRDPYTANNDGQGPAPYSEVAWLHRDPSARVARSVRMREMRHNRAGPRGRRHRTRPAAPHRARSGTVSRERMVEEVVKTYHVTYERDESGWWVASVRGL